jgi:hypothetical protein
MSVICTLGMFVIFLYPGNVFLTVRTECLLSVLGESVLRECLLSLNGTSTYSRKFVIIIPVFFICTQGIFVNHNLCTVLGEYWLSVLRECFNLYPVNVFGFIYPYPKVQLIPGRGTSRPAPGQLGRSPAPFPSWQSRQADGVSPSPHSWYVAGRPILTDQLA